MNAIIGAFYGDHFAEVFDPLFYDIGPSRNGKTRLGTLKVSLTFQVMMKVDVREAFNSRE
jgi:hypothetical protein